MKDIINTYVSECNKDYKVGLSYIGEGYSGDFDETNNEDEPLLRIDIRTRDVLDRRRWSNEDVYSACTSLSARVTETEAKEMCRKVLDYLSKMSKTDLMRQGEYAYQKAWEEALLN